LIGARQGKPKKGRYQMRYSILKYGLPMLTHIEELAEAKEEAIRFVTPVVGSEFIEIQDSSNETITIGYFDGRRFHWTEDKVQTEAWKSCRFVTRPLLWSGNILKITFDM
jgi:hypothetical protein